MVVILVCVAMVLLGLVLIVRWGGREFVAEPFPGPVLPAGWTARVFLQRLVLLVSSAVVAGLLMAGAGGRLVMRLLAVTAGDEAQGKLTEADQRVGVISTSGTIGLLVFGGILGGFVAAAAYILLRRWLPGGRLAGLALGLGLLVVLAPQLEPLRRDNVDFDLVGPGPLSVASFGLVALLQGSLTVAVANRLSGVVPLLDRSWRSVALHLPLALLLPLGIFLPPLVLALVLAIAVGRTAAAVGWFRGRTALIAGRVVLGLVVLAASPRFVTTVVDIAGRGG